MNAEAGQLWSCVQAITSRRCLQAVPRQAEQPAELPLTHLAMRDKGAAMLLKPAKLITRLLAKGLWLFVLFIPVKLVLRLLGIHGSDYVTFVFVLYVVALFASLVLVVALQWLAGPRSTRKPRAALHLPDAKDALAPRLERAGAAEPEPTGAEHLQLLSRQQHPAATALRVRGRLDGGRGVMAGTPLVCERWEERAGGIARFFAARPFVVAVEGQPPVLVQLNACAALWADYRRVASSSPPPLPLAPERAAFLSQRLGPAADKAHECVLRQGDEIELLAYAVQRSISSAEAPFQQSPEVDQRGPYRGELDRLIVAHPRGHSSLILRAIPS